MMVQCLIIIICLFSSPGQSEARSLESVLKSGKLYAAFTEKAYNGIHKELAQALANHLNVELSPVIVPWGNIFSIEGNFPQEVVTNPSIAYNPDIFNQCDVICNSITILPWRKKLMDFVEAFKITDLLITHESKRLNDYSELKGKRITFLGNTTFEEHIKEIDRQIGGGILLLPTQKTQECYKNVTTNQADGLILDSDNALLFMKENKGYEISFPVGHIAKCGWGVKKQNDALRKEIQNFFAGLIGTREIDPFFVNYFGINHETYNKIVQAHSKKTRVESKWKRDLDEIIAQKKLIIAVRERPFVYKKKGKRQFNHALALAFAKELGVKTKLYHVPSFSDYWKNEDGVIDRQAAYTPPIFKNFDIACDVIEPMDWRQNKVDILSFFPLVQTVIARADTPIQYIDDLHHFKGVTSKSSTYEEILKYYGMTNFFYAKTSDFAENILNKKADYAVVENGFFYIRSHPELQVKLVLGKIQERGWAIKKNHPRLKHKLYEFFEKAASDGLIDDLLIKQTGISFKEMNKFTRRFHWKYQVGKLSYVNYSKNDGLPQEPVVSIFQDSDGLMWFGTTAGLVRYNGRTMQVMDITDGLSGNVILDIVQGNDGILYIGTDNGLSTIDNDRIKTILDGFESRKVLIDNQNNKWILSNQLIVYTHDNQIHSVSDRYPQLSGYIWDMTLQQNRDGVFLATENGVYSLNNQYNFVQKNTVPCHALSTGADGYLWMASKGKIIVDTGAELITANDPLNIEDINIKTIERVGDDTLYMVSDSKIIEILSLNQDAMIYDTHVGLLPGTIHSVFQDNEFNLWVGYVGNIQKFTNTSLRAFYPRRFNGEINQIFQDQNKRLWISSSNGVYCFKDTIIDITARLDLGERKCHIAQYDANHILIANASGLYLLDKHLKLAQQKRFNPPILHLFSIFVSPQKEIFLMTRRMEIIYYKSIDSAPQIFKNQSTRLVNMLMMHQGQIIGGNAAGLIRFDGNQFVQDARLNTHVHTIYSEGDRLWLGTDKGFGVYQNNKLHIPVHLANTMVYAVAKEKHGSHFYLGTDKGFSYFNPDTDEIVFSMDQRDGMPVNRVSSNALFVDADNLLWIGTYNGISIFDITKRPLLKFKPECHIEQVYVNAQPINPSLKMVRHDTPLKLSWDQNNLMFNLTGLSFKDEQSIRYGYYMRGLTSYYATGTTDVSHKVIYHNLKPGKYTFHYRAKGKDNIWCAYRSFSFDIHKPFWRTIPFYIFVTISIVGLFWLSTTVFTRIRLKQSQKHSKILKKKVRERTYKLEKINKELTQVNSEQSRFFSIISQDLRNPFSAVMGLTDLLKSYYDMLDDAEKKGYIDEIHNTTALLNKILENLHKWSGIQSGKLGAGASEFHLQDVIQEHIQVHEQAALKKQIQIDNQVPSDIMIFADANLLMIMVDNLLSNAIKYSNPESCVTLSANQKEDQTVLSIKDEGVGIDEAHVNKLFFMDNYYATPGTANEKGTGLGLLICKVIVDKHEGEIKLESKKGEGCTVIVTFPLQGT